MFKSFAARLSLVSFLCSALVIAVLSSFLYLRAIRFSEVGFKRYMGNLTEVSARLISGEEVQAIPLVEGCERLPATKFLIKKLQGIRSVNKAIFDMYLMVPSSRPDHLRFVTNADRERTPVGCGEDYDAKKDPAILRGLHETYVNLMVHNDKWGSWISAYSPVKTASGETVALLGMDIAQETVTHLQSFFLKRFLIAIGLALIFSFGLRLLTAFWLTVPIRRLVKGMETVAGGHLDHLLERFSQTEFDRMAVIFNQMTAAVKEIMYEREVSAREHESVRRELEIAAEIQRSIFPPAPPQVEGLEIAAKSVPAKEVGGDYYDFLPSVADDKMGFIIADAAGKGLPGTLYMTRSRSVFKVISSQEKEPGMTLSRSNKYIVADFSSRKGMFITALYLLYDKLSKEVTYSNAGHHCPLWYKSKEKAFGSLTTRGAPVGIISEQRYPQETIQLTSNDLLVMFTDGVIEAKAENGERFGIERLKKLIADKSALGAQDLFETIESSIQRFIGKAPPFDDMTLIVIRVL